MERRNCRREKTKRKEVCVLASRERVMTCRSSHPSGGAWGAWGAEEMGCLIDDLCVVGSFPTNNACSTDTRRHGIPAPPPNAKKIKIKFERDFLLIKKTRQRQGGRKGRKLANCMDGICVRLCVRAERAAAERRGHSIGSTLASRPSSVCPGPQSLIHS